MHKTLVICAILVACVALNQGAKTKTKACSNSKTSKTRNSDIVTRNGLFRWTSFNNVDVFNTNDDGTTWNWVQNGRIIMRFSIEKADWVANSVLTLILKRRDLDNFFVKLTPSELSWGTSVDGATNFYAYGQWSSFGNSLDDQTNVDTSASTGVDVANKLKKRVVPIPSRFLKDTPITRNGVFKWIFFNDADFFNTNDDGTTWNWVQSGRIIMRFDLNRTEWSSGNVFTIILKRKDVDFFVKLTPYEAYWGLTQDNVTNFSGNGKWSLFGNSLNDQASSDDADVDVTNKSKKRVIPIPSRFLKDTPVERNGLFRWTSFNNVDVFNTNDDGTTWNWVQNGRIIMRFGLEKADWTVGGLFTLILKRREADNFFVKLTPYEFSWGTSVDGATNFYAYGQWSLFGNSLNDQTNDDTSDSTDVNVVDRSTKRSVPIPSRILKKLTAPVVRNGVFRWKLFNKDKEESFNTNDDGSVWLWFQKGRNTIQLVNFKLEWTPGSVLSVILKRKDLEFYVKLTPTEAFWGTSPDAITNFYASGGWDTFGNSLSDLTSGDTTVTDDVIVVDTKKRRTVRIPSRFLKSH